MPPERNGAQPACCRGRRETERDAILVQNTIVPRVRESRRKKAAVEGTWVASARWV